MSNLPSVVICASAPEQDFEPLQGLADLILPTENVRVLTQKEVIRYAKEKPVQGLIIPGEFPVDAEFLNEFPHLKVIANTAAGYNNLPLDELTRRGIWATNTPEAFVDATADATMGLLLGVARYLPLADQFVRNGKWHRTPVKADQWAGMELRGKTIGIIGFGRTGQAVATRAEAFGMKVIYTRRSNQTSPGQRNLQDLLAEADIISLHVPLNEETHHLINKETLSKMRPGAILINMARGSVVNEKDLIAALREGTLGAAALDVFEDEPRVSQELFGLANVVMAPHLGGATRESRSRARRQAAQNIADVLQNERPETPVNDLEPAKPATESAPVSISSPSPAPAPAAAPAPPLSAPAKAPEAPSESKAEEPKPATDTAASSPPPVQPVAVGNAAIPFPPGSPTKTMPEPEPESKPDSAPAKESTPPKPPTSDTAHAKPAPFPAPAPSPGTPSATPAPPVSSPKPTADPGPPAKNPRFADTTASAKDAATSDSPLKPQITSPASSEPSAPSAPAKPAPDPGPPAKNPNFGGQDSGSSSTAAPAPPVKPASGPPAPTPSPAPTPPASSSSTPSPSEDKPAGLKPIQSTAAPGSLSAPTTSKPGPSQPAPSPAWPNSDKSDAPARPDASAPMPPAQDKESSKPEAGAESKTESDSEAKPTVPAPPPQPPIQRDPAPAQPDSKPRPVTFRPPADFDPSEETAPIPRMPPMPPTGDSSAKDSDGNED